MENNDKMIILAQLGFQYLPNNHNHFHKSAGTMNFETAKVEDIVEMIYTKAYQKGWDDKRDQIRAVIES